MCNCLQAFWNIQGLLWTADLSDPTWMRIVHPYGQCVPIVRRGVQNPTWKNVVPPKGLIPTWNDFTYNSAKISHPPKIKFTVHSHLEYVIQKVFKITGVKLTIGRFSLQSNHLYENVQKNYKITSKIASKKDYI